MYVHLTDNCGDTDFASLCFVAVHFGKKTLNSGDNKNKHTVWTCVSLYFQVYFKTGKIVVCYYLVF